MCYTRIGLNVFKAHLLNRVRLFLFARKGAPVSPKQKVARGTGMTKAELKTVLRDYAAIQNAIGIENAQVCIKRYRTELHIRLPSWVSGVKRSINELLKTESDTVRKIVELSYIKGCKDREAIMRLPVSDSGYYRIKRHIEEKIYELCILYGYVTAEDILRDDI